jgi:hypothetical protein
MTLSTTPGKNVIAGVVDTSKKFIISVIVTGNHLSAVSTMVINLSLVSTTPQIKKNP